MRIKELQAGIVIMKGMSMVIVGRGAGIMIAEAGIMIIIMIMNEAMIGTAEENQIDLVIMILGIVEGLVLDQRNTHGTMTMVEVIVTDARTDISLLHQFGVDCGSVKMPDFPVVGVLDPCPRR